MKNIKSNLFSAALSAAKAAGEAIKKNFNKTKIISCKKGTELVTNVDIACDKLIRKVIQARFPDHNFISEELPRQQTSSAYTWRIDPIDGTHNFIRNIPHFCVSIGLEYKKNIIVAVVFDPIKNELFSAQKGMGAFLNNKKIKVSATKLLKDALLATGFSYDYFTNPDDNIKQTSIFFKRSKDSRLTGSAALDLCYVGAGRFDGFWERNLKSWDVAAGILIVEEAGGRVTDYNGRKIDLTTVDRVLASNVYLHNQMFRVIEESYL